ncbi:hypothetical protein G6F49_003723 [Rhizopus delemar]|nr:hypothetical protein G6F49_003723 [Rhizopus delemar]
MHYLNKLSQLPFKNGSTKLGIIRLYSSTPYSEQLKSWKQNLFKKKRVATDTITASQINLLGNTLDHPKFNYDQLPQEGTAIPLGWHLVFFPVRVPEKELAREGYHKDWSPPGNYTHRIWAGGQVDWVVKNPLRVGDKITMEASLRDVQFKDDSVFVWVNRTIHNQHRLALSESRCCIYTDHYQMREREVANITENKSCSHDILSNPEFTYSIKPTPVTLFRFSAITFNAHLIHYDHVYATEVEKQKGCLTHGPLSLIFMVNQLDHHLATRDFDQTACEKRIRNRQIKSIDYRCLNPLPVDEPVTVCGRWKIDQGLNPSYDVWIVDSHGKIAVKASALIDDA